MRSALLHLGFLALALLRAMPTLSESTAIASYSDAPQILDGQTGIRIALPPQQTYTGLRQIPDAAHPYVAPGPDDQRGPCPGLNTLANHGYIPRNGVASFEELVSGVMEGFNMEMEFGASIVAVSMLGRGNPFVNKLSIGGVSPLVPPLPGGIGSPSPGPGGIALHGSFEGDASLSREDVHIGDNRHFQNLLYDKMLLQLGRHGSDAPGLGPDGKHTVFNVETMAAIKEINVQHSFAANPAFTMPIKRFGALFIAASFVIDLFANGTTGSATLPIIGSFFRNETFPDNWFRAPAPKRGDENTTSIREAALRRLASSRPHPFYPGWLDERGVYVREAPKPAPFNASLGCGVYYDHVSQMPAGLANTTGVFYANVRFLAEAMYKIMAEPACDGVVLLPFGPPVD